MKFPLLQLFFLLLFCSDAFAQAGMWTWVSGDSIPNSPGVFGVQGVPNSLNHPPALYEPCEWTDLQGNFWLFGGGYPDVYADLWKFNPITSLWTWVKGNGILNDTGNYGVIGIPSILNLPPARGVGAVSWIDLNGDFWMFGGRGSTGAYNDLWKYEVSSNTWTWINGSKNVNQQANYGIMGIPSFNNNPGSRNECNSAWVDLNNNLWLFGGMKDATGCLNDLWRFNPATLEWTWMKGSNALNQIGNYGILGTVNITNVPGARSAYNHWTDSNGDFWFFGGINTLTIQSFNDVWRYSIADNNWTWMNGTDQYDNAGNYGSPCIESITNLPPSRWENRSFWSDKNDNFWFYGGRSGNINLNSDLWVMDKSKLHWTFIKGDTIINQLPVYGINGIPNINNSPGSRFGSISWFDQNSNSLFLFGGFRYPLINYANDLWKYEIDPNCPIITGVPNNLSYKTGFKIIPNPNDGSFQIVFNTEQGTLNVEVRILNAMGQVVFYSLLTTDYSQNTTGHSQIKTQLPNGIYSISITTNNGIISKRIEVIH